MICKKCCSAKRMTLKSGYSQCLDCHNARSREWNKRNRKPVDPSQYREYKQRWQLENRYSLTWIEYQNMLFYQGGCCAICMDIPNGQALSVDHCHETETIRGLLCNRCNVGITNFRDKPDLLEAAARYLCGKK